MIEIISRLPAGYQEVEYIQTTGTQYINTGFIPNQDTRVIVDVELVSASSVLAVLGSRSVAGSATDSFAVWNMNGVLRFDYNEQTISTGLTAGGRHSIDINKNVATIDGQIFTATYGAFDSVYPFLLSSANNGGTADTRMSSGKWYSCEIYDNEILVRDLIPCYRKADNVAGMYDLANGGFYTNAGNGTLAVGADTGSIIVITEGGVIPKKRALRRRIMMSETQGVFTFEYTGNYVDNRDENGIGTVRFTSSGTLTVLSGKATVFVYILGAGGGAVHCVVYGDDNYGGTGGSGGNQTVEVKLTTGSYEIVIGTGGKGKAGGSGNYSAGNGGDTSAFGYTSTGGKGATMEYFASPTGGTGGSPNGKAGKIITSSSGTGGSPNGGGVSSGTPQAGGDGYVELTFS